MLTCIDPGTDKSGVVFLDKGRVQFADVYTNQELIDALRRDEGNDPVVIEMVASFGMPVGREVFETVAWIGRFMEAVTPRAVRLYRRDIKLHFCQSARAKDPHIWQAILDRYGGKEKAIGCKKAPGPLYSVKSHARAALALGLAWLDGVRSEGL